MNTARRNAYFVAIVGMFGVTAAVTACSSILGFESLTHLPADASDSVDANNNADSQSSSSSGDSGNGVIDSALVDSGDGATTCVADLTSDPKHCGRCNHDCVGGACQASKCQPLKLADGLAIPEGLVVDATDVFVTELDQNRIVKFGKNALGPCTAAPLPQQCVFNEDQANVFQPTAMGIDATNIYRANTGAGNDHSIKSCPRTGCGAQAAKLVAQLGQEAFAHLFGSGDVLPLELIVKDGQIFWPESLGGAIRSTPVAGGGAITTYLDNGSFMPLAIAVDDTQIFFTDDTNQHPTRIQAVPRDGSGSDGGAGLKVIASTPARPYGIGLTAAGNLYWTVPFVGQIGDGVVQATPKTSDGGAPIGAVATNEVEPRALMVDATNVYWLITGSAQAATGLVVYCPLTGCPQDGPIVLAKDQRLPLHITQDESAIYWSNEGLPASVVYDGQVWKIAKP